MSVTYVFKNGWISIFLLGMVIGSAMAMEVSEDLNEKSLVIGCRPWDPNIQDVPGIDKAHFVDRMAFDKPEEAYANFHHYDLNDTYDPNKDETNRAHKFSDFVSENLGNFETIIIDWFTYQHITRDDAWDDFCSLLNIGGSLVVPVASQNLRSGKPLSKSKATEMQNKLSQLFNSVCIWPYQEMPHHAGSSLFKRLGACSLFLHVEQDLSAAEHPLWEILGNEESRALHLEYNQLPALIKSTEGNYRFVFALGTFPITVHPIHVCNQPHVDFLNVLFEKNYGRVGRVSLLWSSPIMQIVSSNLEAKNLYLPCHLPYTLDSFQPFVVIATK